MKFSESLYQGLKAIKTSPRAPRTDFAEFPKRRSQRKLLASGVSADEILEKLK